MAYDEGLATRLREQLADRPGYSEKRMFGGLAMMLRGNMTVGVHGDALIARVEPAQHEQLLREPGARAFDLTGRPMAGWLLVDPVGHAEDDDLTRWVDRCVTYTASLPAK